MVSRAQFFDGDDTAKWAGEAARQLETYPPGQENGGAEFRIWSERYGVSKEATAYDFGCGTGLARPGFSGMRYVGIDQNPAMIAGFRQRWLERDPQVSVYTSPLNQILQNHPHLAQTGDVGCFLTVLQHNHWETAAEILDQAYGVLRPGAFLFLVEATFNEKHYPAETRRKYGLPDPIDPERLACVDGGAVFTYKGWCHFLRRHGFEVVDYDGDCGYVALRR